MSQGGCLGRPSRCGQACLSSESDLAPSGLLSQASCDTTCHLVSQSGRWGYTRRRTHTCRGVAGPSPQARVTTARPLLGVPGCRGRPGTPLQSTPRRPCCTSQPCVQPRPRLRPTARPCGTTMLGPCSHVPCLPKTGAPGAGLGTHLCPRGRDSTQHELAQHTAVEGRKQRREGGKEGRRERGKEGRGRRGEQTGREQGCREQGGARAQSW